MKRVALSSVPVAPLSGDTRAALLQVGLEEETVDATPRTELWAMSVLGVQGAESVIGVPVCFRREYSPQRELCVGCAWMSQCWHTCQSYLDDAHRLGPPEGVAAEVVDRVLRRKFKPPPMETE